MMKQQKMKQKTKTKKQTQKQKQKQKQNKTKQKKEMGSMMIIYNITILSYYVCVAGRNVKQV